MEKKQELPASFDKHYPKEDKKTYLEYYHCEATRKIRQLLCKVAGEKIETAIKASEKKGRYEVPCWSELQADDIGYRRALREVITLLTK